MSIFCLLGLRRVCPYGFYHTLFLQKFIHFQHFSISPDSLQIIEKPVLFIKYMHDHIAVIHENPAGIAVSLDLLCFKSSTSKLFLNIVYDRLNLVGVGTACDYKVICNYGNSMNIDYLDILSFLSSIALQAICAIIFSVLTVLMFCSFRYSSNSTAVSAMRQKLSFRCQLLVTLLRLLCNSL